MICRAAWARRSPRIASPVSCESRMRTSASSAATKKAFSKTRTATARIFRKIMAKVVLMSEIHLAKHDLENILQGHDAHFIAFAGKHNGHTLPRPLHLAQRGFQAGALGHEHR